MWALWLLYVPFVSFALPLEGTQEHFLFEPIASLPVANATKSFWIDTPGSNLLAAEGSTGSLTNDADVCIIGSGMTGISSAYHIAKAVEELGLEEASLNVKAVVLEARDFCRNGGHLTPYSFFKFLEYEEKYGEEEALKSLRLENRTAMAMVKIIQDHGLSDVVDLVAGGHAHLIVSDKEYEYLKSEHHAAQRAGFNVEDVEWLSKEEVHSTYGASYPAVKFDAFNFWPLKFVTQLYLLANSSTPRFSLSLHTRTPVTSVVPLPSTRRWSLTTPRGAIQCSYVLHATNAYASRLLPQFSGRKGIIPTRGQVVAVRADTPVSDAWKASWDGLDHYWFPRPLHGSDSASRAEGSVSDDHPLVILGGGREIGGPTYEQFITDDSGINANISAGLRTVLPKTFPSIFKEEKDPEMEWTGIMGYTTMTDPFVGPVVESLQPKRGTDSGLYDGQFIAAGYNGHGMPRAFSCAEAVAGMITAKITGKRWVAPEWLPERYLTWNREA